MYEKEYLYTGGNGTTVVFILILLGSVSGGLYYYYFIYKKSDTPAPVAVVAPAPAPVAVVADPAILPKLDKLPIKGNTFKIPIYSALSPMFDNMRNLASHSGTKVCGKVVDGKLVIAGCDNNNPANRWKFDKYDEVTGLFKNVPTNTCLISEDGSSISVTPSCNIFNKKMLWGLTTTLPGETGLYNVNYGKCMKLVGNDKVSLVPCTADKMLAWRPEYAGA